MTTPEQAFAEDCRREIRDMGLDANIAAVTAQWTRTTLPYKYSYHFSWYGRPIIQYPQDMIAMQEIIASVRPDLVIETGIAHGGGLIFYSSLLELNALCGGPENAAVLGIDIDIRAHNRKAIEAHPLSRRITMFEGSSTAPEMVERVRTFAGEYRNILVCLDSCHTHEHVLAELEAYAPLVAPGGYCVVFDTIIETLPPGTFPDRPWEKGDNAMTAVDAFMKRHPEFVHDEMMDAKLLISMAPRGYLKRVH